MDNAAITVRLLLKDFLMTDITIYTMNIPLEAIKSLKCKSRIHITKTSDIRSKILFDKLSVMPTQSMWLDINTINFQTN